MSDYYGSPTLEDWLAEEVFDVDEVPADVVAKFEQWRVGIESDIIIFLRNHCPGIAL